MVDACAMHGIYPYYGPFGDIADVVACEDQFRNAFLLGCVGTWSLHPKQIAIANKVFSPSVEDVAHARRVVAAMGDGTGAVMLDGKMEDDASLKQCLVMVELAEQLAAIDPELKAQYDAIEVADAMIDRPPAAPLGPLHAELQRAGPREGEDHPLRRADPRPRGRRRARRQAGRPRGRVRRGGERRVRPPRGDHPGQRRRHRVARRRPRPPRAPPGRTRSSCPRSTAPTPCAPLVDALEKHGAPDHTKLWAMVETPYAMLHAEEIAGASERLTVLVMGTNDLAKELYAEHVPGRQPLLTGLGLALLAARATGMAILDGVYNDVKDTDGFLAECRQGRRDGLRRQDPDPPRPGRGRQRGVRAERAGGRGRPRHPRRRGRPAPGPAWSPTTAG